MIDLNDPRALWRGMWREARTWRVALPSQRPMPPGHSGERRVWLVAHRLRDTSRTRRIVPERALPLP